MPRNSERLVAEAIARMVGHDPLASVLVSAAVRDHSKSFDAAAAFVLVVDVSHERIERARALATTRRERQHLAIVECWLSADWTRVALLAREHLSEFPDDLVISWLAGRR